MPRPGVRAKGDPEKTKPYIANVPEHTEQRDMGDGFLIVACDGVWDEMSSEEAVHIVAKLILDLLSTTGLSTIRLRALVSSCWRVSENYVVSQNQILYMCRNDTQYYS